MMTADEARKLTHDATTPDDEHVSVVLNLWYAGIKKAAMSGRDSVRETELDRVRMQIPDIARRAARAHLRVLGYKVEPVEDGRNEDTWEVSWKSAIVPPQGGSGTSRPTVGPKGGTGAPPKG